MANEYQPRILSAAGDRSADYTERASTATRALTLGTIAVAWLFLSGISGSTANALVKASQHPLLAWSISLAVLSLAFDASQYALGSFLWHRYYVAVEHILRAPSNRDDARTARRTDRSWQSAARSGLVTEILNAAEINTAALAADTQRSIDAARDILEQYRQHVAAHTIYPQSPASSAAPDSANLDVVVNSILSRPLSDPRIVSAVRCVFWAKMLAALVAGALLIAFCVNDVL